MINHMKALAVAAALAASGAAHATEAIIFDYNGAAAGGQITVGSFDWSPDNALAVGSVPIPIDPTTNLFNLYAQASLGNFLDPSNNVIGGTGLNSTFEITFQTGFSEYGSATIDTTGPIAGATAGFTLASGSDLTVNFFNIYYDTTPDTNQVAGTGYGDNDGNGTIDDGSILILQALVIGNTTVFTVPFSDPDNNGVFNTPTIGDLDNHGSDDQGNTQTVFGNGGGSLTADVFAIDSAYFITDITQLVIDLLFNTSNITPFSQADPSDLVVGNAPDYGFDGTNATNGFTTCGGTETSCDFHFQADANMAFNAVPEPGSLLLLGIGLMGMVWMTRRRLA